MDSEVPGDPGGCRTLGSERGVVSPAFWVSAGAVPYGRLHPGLSTRTVTNTGTVIRPPGYRLGSIPASAETPGVQRPRYPNLCAYAARTVTQSRLLAPQELGRANGSPTYRFGGRAHLHPPERAAGSPKWPAYAPSSRPGATYVYRVWGAQPRLSGMSAPRRNGLSR